MAQAVGTPEAHAAAAMNAPGPAANSASHAQPQASAPEKKAGEDSAKPAPPAEAGTAANAAPPRKEGEARKKGEKPAEPAPVAALDAEPNPAAPDPLTPPETNGPAPKAPGAGHAKPADTAQAPQPEIDPLGKQILAYLDKPGSRSHAKDDIAGAKAYYEENKGKPIWISREGFNHKANKAIREIRNADDWGLEASAFPIPSNPGGSSSLETRAAAEAKMSLTVLKYARYARGGRLNPPSISPMMDRRPHIFDPKSVLEGISDAGSADAYLRGLHPKHEQFKRLRQAYLALMGKGTGSSLSPHIPSGPDFKPGDDNRQIALIRKRLGVSAEGAKETVYDVALLEAVNLFQKEHGLEITGIIDRKLRASLNKEASGSGRSRSSSNEDGGGSVEAKRMRLLVNMERWRWMPEHLGEFYVWDSITEQYARIYDHGKVVLQEKIVVGKPNTPTPSFSASMRFVIFNPEWGVPEGIKVNEIAPRLRSSGGGGGGLFGFGAIAGGGSSEVLQRMGGLRVSLNGKPVNPDSVDWSRVDIRRYTFTQGAGAKNVLGQVKFRFPNKHDVYMHDTVNRELFGNGQRAFSHGCMRTQNPLHFAEVLLAHDRDYPAGQVQKIVASGRTREIALRKPVPVHIVYFTAKVDEKGQVHYYHDLYGLDSRVAAALEGKPVRVASEPAPPSAPSSSTEQRGEEPRSWAHPHAQASHRPAPERRSGNPFQYWNN
jgi:murein L,D-transpeptidase YcbB/YkuD